MECYKQRWVGAILVSALVAESRNCRHGFFSSSGTGCGIPQPDWSGCPHDAPQTRLSRESHCCFYRRREKSRLLFYYQAGHIRVCELVPGISRLVFPGLLRRLSAVPCLFPLPGLEAAGLPFSYILETWKRLRRKR